MGSPIDVGEQYPFITFFTPPRISGNFCYGVMKPVLHASRVLGSNPGCLSFVCCVAHSFLSLTINSLFASGSWLCYSLCYCVFHSFLTHVFVDCHVFTIETTAHCCRLPFQCGIHRDYADEASGCPHNHAGFVYSIIGFPWC